MHKWLEKKRAACQMRFSPIDFADSKEWIIGPDAFRHKAGAFFSVEGVGARSSMPALDGVRQPIINQPEVGILGFLVTREEGGYFWLVQAKAEPGNMEGVQLAPTVQATFSNYMRKHGGSETHYLQYFTDEALLPAANSLQSEQGTRFLRKFNRNATVEVGVRLEPASDQFCWLSAAEMRDALRTHYAVNTDARSVMVCGPWRLLADGDAPFTNANANKLGFQASYTTREGADVVARAAALLNELRRGVALEVSRVPLSELDGWLVAPDRIEPKQGTNSPLSVRHYSVEAPEREKTQWDQPLVLSSSFDNVVLLGQKRDGLMRFLLRPAYEIGLTGGVEFGPSYKRETERTQPEWFNQLVEDAENVTLLNVQQSDEGGRFMHSCSHYSICLMPEDRAVEDDGTSLWVTLAELEELCGAPGLLTNEARSVVSLLLSFC